MAKAVFRFQTGTCRHCRRPITKPRTWLHTDGLPDCLDEWRWDRTGTFAEPAPEPVPLPEPKWRGPYTTWKDLP